MKQAPRNPSILIFIKPWDDEVFLSFITLLEFIEHMEGELGISVTLVLPEDLQVRTQAYMSEGRSTLRKEINAVLTESNKHEIDYIITLGGDGTLLWAAKQYNRGRVPPIITFTQGSLGFMCNFTIDDRAGVLTPIFQSVKS